ncbi:MAG: TraM recognition domain-containing protein [Planctomycetes bacterium]|nr:TraM recognition domain-containing protein [Planctomycetota bacterium]
MRSYLLGHIHGTNHPVRIPRRSFDTHWHLIGGTGKGKTTAIHTILHQLLRDPVHEPCVVIIDRMGNLSFELLLWMASDFCTDDVRERLVYVEPSREDVVMGFNPLRFQTDGEGFYKATRTSEIVLRGWSSQNLEEMPRLARWLFNSFWAAAQMGLTVADCMHFILPGSPYHRPLLQALPPRLQYEWQELMRSRSGEVMRVLESTQNRLKPYFESPILRLMFGSSHSHLDMHRFMRDGRIVLLNLAPNNRLPEQIADAIGGMVINEVLSTARSLPLGVRYPTFLFLDEFQRFVGPDIESAIPEMRQRGVKLILSHQSFSQLERGDIDLTTIIFQAQSRMVFGVQGEDADLLAHELASITFDPARIKDEIYSRRQRIAGHRTRELSSCSTSRSDAENWNSSYGEGWSRRLMFDRYGQLAPLTHSKTEASGSGRASASAATDGKHETLVPVHQDFVELSSRSYVTFDEDRNVWARNIRNLSRGRAFVRLVDEPALLDVDVKRTAPGYLSWETDRLMEEMPEVIDEMQQLVEKNFQSDYFVPPRVIEAESEERLRRVIAPAASRPTDTGTADAHFL